MKHTLALIQLTIPQRNLSKQLPFHSLTKSYESGTYQLAMYQQNPCYKISIDDQHGRYLAEHLGIGDQNSEQRVKLLIWTGKEKAC